MFVLRECVLRGREVLREGEVMREGEHLRERVRVFEGLIALRVRVSEREF